NRNATRRKLPRTQSSGHLLGAIAFTLRTNRSFAWSYCVHSSDEPEYQSSASVFALMSSDRIIIDAIKVAQDLLWQNLPPTHNLTDAATVMRFRELVRSQAVRSVLERSSDTVLAFALRAVERAVSDQSGTNRETINQLWDVLDDPHLNKAL